MTNINIGSPSNASRDSGELDHCDRPHDPLSRCEAFINLSNRFLGLLAGEASRDSANDPSREYPFVAMDNRQVFRQLALARRWLTENDRWTTPSGTPTLLDVGCGIGNVMLLAEQLAFEVYGLEKDPAPCAVARRFFDARRVAAADIWEYQDYHRFQVIYYFRPFADRQLQWRFERLIEERLQAGGILIANHKNSDTIASDHRFQRLDPELPVWHKKE